MDSSGIEWHVQVIFNCSYLVRHYARGARSAIQSADRDAAIVQLGKAVRDALVACKQPRSYEAILTAALDGLAPREEHRF